MRAVPELDWPAFDAHDLSDILPDLCQGLTRLQEVRQADKVRLLEARLTPVQRQELRQSAPIAIRVPSGREIRLHYEQGRSPVLAVRLQELFGWTETPRLARGRTAVVLELLGPNHRPVQITSDLRSFWTTTYQQVRKDLRGRYPKHHWPEDPFTAQPASGPRKRGT